MHALFAAFWLWKQYDWLLRGPTTLLSCHDGLPLNPGTESTLSSSVCFYRFSVTATGKVTKTDMAVASETMQFYRTTTVCVVLMETVMWNLTVGVGNLSPEPCQSRESLQIYRSSGKAFQ